MIATAARGEEAHWNDVAMCLWPVSADQPRGGCGGFVGLFRFVGGLSKSQKGRTGANRRAKRRTRNRRGWGRWSSRCHFKQTGPEQQIVVAIDRSRENFWVRRPIGANLAQMALLPSNRSRRRRRAKGASYRCGTPRSTERPLATLWAKKARRARGAMTVMTRFWPMRNVPRSRRSLLLMMMALPRSRR